MLPAIDDWKVRSSNESDSVLRTERRQTPYEPQLSYLYLQYRLLTYGLIIAIVSPDSSTEDTRYSRLFVGTTTSCMV